MAVKLSLVERKWLLKCYWKVENVVEVQRCWRVEFGTAPPTRVTITRIRDKFEVDGTVQVLLKGRCGRKGWSTDNESAVTVMQVFARSPKKSLRQCSRDWYREIQCSTNFESPEIEALHSEICQRTKCQTGCRSVRRPCWVCITVEGGYFEQVRAKGSLRNRTQHKLYYISNNPDEMSLCSTSLLGVYCGRRWTFWTCMG